jgi:uncharacterized FlaG/YvyC family protein
MNIRSVTNPLVPVEGRGPEATAEARAKKLDAGHEDRDADGRRHTEDQDQSPLTDEELKQAKEYLDRLEGLKANGLSYTVEEQGLVRVILIRDQNGQVVRRIPEYEMRLLVEVGGATSGRIFHKAG